MYDPFNYDENYKYLLMNFDKNSKIERSTFLNKLLPALMLFFLSRRPLPLHLRPIFRIGVGFAAKERRSSALLFRAARFLAAFRRLGSFCRNFLDGDGSGVVGADASRDGGRIWADEH